MKASTALVSRVCTALGLPSATVAESLGITSSELSIPAVSLADREWDSVSLGNVHAANDFNSLALALESSREGSPAQQAAIRKIAELFNKKK